MKNTNGAKPKAGKTSAKQNKAAVKRGEDIKRYKRLLEDNEARLSSRTNVKGEPLTSEQLTALHEIVQKQRDKLAELSDG